MAKDMIVVPLKRSDRVEEIVPYLEEVARPGMRVVFLINHPVSSFKWLQAYCGIMECGLENSVALRKIIESYSIEMRKRLAEQRVFHTCGALQKVGVKMAVEVCAGGLRQTLTSYILTGEVDLVVMRSGIGLRVLDFLQRTVACLAMCKRPSTPPVLFLHSGAWLQPGH